MKEFHINFMIWLTNTCTCILYHVYYYEQTHIAAEVRTFASAWIFFVRPVIYKYFTVTFLVRQFSIKHVARKAYTVQATYNRLLLTVFRTVQFDLVTTTELSSSQQNPFPFQHPSIVARPPVVC